MAISPHDLDALMSGLLEKTAARMEEQKEKKKEDKKEKDKPMKGMSDCSYGSKVAETLEHLASNIDDLFLSAEDRAEKLAEEGIKVPNKLTITQTMDGDGKKINWKRDKMTVGEEPTDPDTSTVKGEVPNKIPTTISEPPGGGEKIPVASPPFFNKNAEEVLDKVLGMLAMDEKVAEIKVPNMLKTFGTEEAGASEATDDHGGSNGNNLRHLITSNREAMNFTKRDAKRDYIKSELREVFDEVHPEKDTVVGRSFEQGTDTSKLASAKEMAGKAFGKAKAVASRTGELLAGGKKSPVMKGNRVSTSRPGNDPSSLFHKGRKAEGAKSMGARAGVAAVGVGGAALAKGKKEEKTANVAGSILGNVAGAAHHAGEAIKNHPGKAGLIAGGAGGLALGGAAGHAMGSHEKAAFVLRMLAEKTAALKEVEEMERLVKKEKKEEKAEEKVAPGIHKAIEKEAELDTDRAARWGAIGGIGTAAAKGLTNVVRGGGPGIVGPAVAGLVGYGGGRAAHRLYHGAATGKEVGQHEKAAFALRKLAEEVAGAAQAMPPQAAEPTVAEEPELPQDPAERDALIMKLQQMLSMLMAAKEEEEAATQEAQVQPQPSQSGPVPPQGEMASPMGAM